MNIKLDEVYKQLKQLDSLANESVLDTEELLSLEASINDRMDSKVDEYTSQMRELLTSLHEGNKKNATSALIKVRLALLSLSGLMEMCVDSIDELFQKSDYFNDVELDD